MMVSSLFLKPEKTNEEAMQEFREISQRQECDNILNCMLGGTLAQQWWTKPNRVFSGQTPDQAWNINPQSVVKYLRNNLKAVYS